MTDESGADASLDPNAFVSEEAAETDVEAVEAEATDKGAESEAGSPPAEETEDKPDPFQERIDKLTRRFRETERDLQAVQKERDDLRKQVASIPKEDQKTLEDFEYDAGKYQAYLLEQVEKRAAEAAERAARGFTEKAAVQQAEIQFSEREKAFAKEVKDYRSVAYDPDVPISEVMAGEIRESDIGPELLYHLAKNQDVAARVANLPERAAIREIVRLEGQLRTEKAKAAEKSVSKAPPPPSKLGGSEPGLKVAASDPKSDKMSDAEWIRRREQELAKKRA